MTSTTTAPNTATDVDEPTAPRPGSRAHRMAQPLARHVLVGLAEHYRLCVRPVVLRRIDRQTGEATIVEVPCGARSESKCKPCAARIKRLRQQQIREGWHLTVEPTVEEQPASPEVAALVAMRCQFQLDRDTALTAGQLDQVADLDAGIEQLDLVLTELDVRGTLTPANATNAGRPAKVRSTKRRQDAPDLPRLKVDKRTTGRIYVGRDGRTHQPSTFLTVTLPSYGAVHTAIRMRRDGQHGCECGQLHGYADPLLGTPVDPATYDYRAAALGAIFFAALMDRFWQNARRAAGFDIQYAGTVEMQHRLAPHGHYAIRGTLPNKLLKQIAAATYHQVWWPPFDQLVYTPAKAPTWDTEQNAYVDPTSGQPLPTWDEAIVKLNDPDAQPAHVARLGTIHARGIEAGTKQAERTIRYATKYITKDLTGPTVPLTAEQQNHHDRLHDALAELPCSPTCANWLLYGVQPKNAAPGLNPGRCSGKVHQRATLGYTGRRVLISRKWSGKTLTDHRGDNHDRIRKLLAAAGETDNHDQGDTADSAEPRRYIFEVAKPTDADVRPYQHRLMHAIAQRERWRAELRKAESLATQRDPDVPATPPAAQAA
jgi:hypothetical protein